MSLRTDKNIHQKLSRIFLLRTDVKDSTLWTTTSIRPSNMDASGNDKALLHRIKFIFMFTLQILALLFSLVIFLFFIKHRAPLKAAQNHGLLLLLTVNFIQLLFNMPLILHFYELGHVHPSTSLYCTWWTFFEYTIYAVGAYLLAVISLQRHMFIFNQHFLRTTWMRILLHYFPLLFSIIYPTVFYLYAIVLYPCDNNPWDYTKKLCGYGNCYLLFDKFLGTFDLLVNNSLPVVIDVVTNIVLILRVFMRKNRARQSVRGSQQRRMMIQLFFLSTLYIICWSPFLTVLFVNILQDPTFMNEIQMDYFSDLVYMVYLLFPWLCLGFFPELRKWLTRLLIHRQRRNTIVPFQSRNGIRTK